MLSDDYARVEMAIRYLEENYRDQPDLKEIASRLNLSEFHFQRLFRRWAGITPKRFVQFLTIEHAKKLLEESRSILTATYESGLSSPSRLHDLFVSVEAVTPGEFKKQGEGLEIAYGFHDSPFGESFVAVTHRGICDTTFVLDRNRERVVDGLRHKWRNARIVENPAATESLAQRIFDASGRSNGDALPLLLAGTNFQIKVWQALLRIPMGYVLTYGDIARQIGHPAAYRAVGQAIAQNPIPFIIPCHRVIAGPRTTHRFGVFGYYQLGTARKKAILAWEAAHLDVEKGRN